MEMALFGNGDGAVILIFCWSRSLTGGVVERVHGELRNYSSLGRETMQAPIL
jgi:hypothetical protein